MYVCIDIWWREAVAARGRIPFPLRPPPTQSTFIRGGCRRERETRVATSGESRDACNCVTARVELRRQPDSLGNNPEGMKLNTPPGHGDTGRQPFPLPSYCGPQPRSTNRQAKEPDEAPPASIARDNSNPIDRRRQGRHDTRQEETQAKDRLRHACRAAPGDIYERMRVTE